MKERVDKWIDSCISFFINHAMWALVVWLIGLLSLNIPKIISFVKEVGEKTVTISNILSFVSVALLCSGIYLIFKFKAIKQKHKQENGTTSSSDYVESSNNSSNISSSKTEEQDSNSLNIIDNIHFKKMSVEIFINSPDDIRYRIKFDGNANKDCVDCFSKSLFWTGDMYLETKVLRNNIDYHLEDNIQKRVTPPFDYTIYFDEPQPNGAPIKFVIETRLSDKDKKMKPYSLFCIKYPIDELEMVLITEPRFVKNIYKCGYHDFTREVEFFRNRQLKREDVGNLIKYSYTTNNPVPWKCYCIEWDFTDDYKAI